MKKIKKIRITTESRLEKKVKSMLNNSGVEYVSDYIKDVLYGGCGSGVVADLIYYADTVKFFKSYKKEINDLLKEEMENTGLPFFDLLGDKWDNEDPLCFDTANQNLLAWFAFEETTRHLAEKLNLDY